MEAAAAAALAVGPNKPQWATPSHYKDHCCCQCYCRPYCHVCGLNESPGLHCRLQRKTAPHDTPPMDSFFNFSSDLLWRRVCAYCCLLLAQFVGNAVVNRWISLPWNENVMAYFYANFAVCKPLSLCNSQA